jgi:hypothetical protein
MSANEARGAGLPARVMPTAEILDPSVARWTIGKNHPRYSGINARIISYEVGRSPAPLDLHDAMLSAGISNVELGRRLDLEEKAVRRLRDPLHRSHIGQIEAALRLLGRRLEIRVLEAT